MEQSEAQIFPSFPQALAYRLRRNHVLRLYWLLARKGKVTD